ncbi:mannitol repressor MtlR [Cricetibacter osteomyelitidis]|uniref:Mannitol repressor MtlR n=1 Tax=Cricetibacter osteomyelitidis TaxID=1521931 RepID=A0A4R2T7R3_9PAST|nr:MltR family transcriptional regulator [Cricetibacter osteomyelitidis]TCP93208.1 mannitol repressor MtlR [Cricetibacter osteomyelitidis]
MPTTEFSIYEKLNEATSVRSFLIASVNIFEEVVDQLMNRIFRKNDFVVQSVINSLFEQSGPLFELAIRLKVLLGLGAISHEVFQDINHFIGLKEQLNNDAEEYEFTDHIITEFAQQLHFQTQRILPVELNPLEKQDSLAFQMKIMRQEKLVKSSLILAVSDICEQLQVESPL